MVEVDGDVGAEVVRRLHLVHQLRGHRVHRDQPAGAGVLGDHAAAVGGDLRDREAERRGVAGQVEEAGEVAAGRLGAALDDVARDDGAGQLVVLRPRPAVAARSPGRRRREASVTRPVTTMSAPASQRPGDAEGAEVGVGGQRAAEPELGGARSRLSPSTQAIRGVRPSSAATSRSFVGEAGGVEAAGVGDDPHAPLEREPEAVGDLGDERAGVARGTGPSAGPCRGSAWSARRGSRR